MAIAYANSDDIPAVDVIAAIEKLHAKAPNVDVAVDHVTLVLHEWRQRSYAWRPISRLPLVENGSSPGRSSETLQASDDA